MKKIFIIFLLLIIPLFSFGQVGLPDGIKEQVSVNFSNSTPDPLEVVSVNVVSYTTNLNKADISWSINGAVKKREVGATKFTFQVGEAGSKTTLDIYMVKQDGSTISKKYEFMPSEVDLFYEAETITPETYPGKALFSNQSPVKIIAEPRLLDSNGKLISKENLVYNWKINDFARSDLSGYGKDFFRYSGSLITRPLKVSVTVSATNSKAVAQKTIILDPTETSVLIYEKNPVLGVMYEKAINSDFSLNREEVEFQIEELFFSKDSLTKINWFLNGKKLSSSSNMKSVIFRNEDKTEGKANISVRTENTTRILQGGDSSFGLIFNPSN